jgi:PKHD-type hydroxylase|tara:strand:+ start:606 stop:1217 length:612 start_codon:yes stop_codon:yes gene_type:complete
MNKNLFWVFPKALPRTVCDDILKFGMSLKPQPGLTGGAPIENVTSQELEQIRQIRRSKVAWVQEPWIYREIFQWLGLANKQAGWNYQISTAEKFQFTHYGVNETYDWHCDSYNEPYPPEKEGLSGLTRKISMTLCLSNSNDYTGGDLQFKFRNSAEDTISTIPETREKGTMIFFPGYVWHRVAPVTSGNRFSLVLWSCGNPYV